MAPVANRLHVVSSVLLVGVSALLATAAPAGPGVAEDPSADERSNFAQVAVHSEPPGAIVLVGGLPIADAEGRLTRTASLPSKVVLLLERGRTHTLTFIKDGYWPQVEKLEVGGSKRTETVRARLRPEPASGATKIRASASRGKNGCESSLTERGEVTIFSEPRAVIYEGDQRVGETPITRQPMAAGCHLLRLVAVGSDREKIFKIKVEANKTSRYNVSL